MTSQPALWDEQYRYDIEQRVGPAPAELVDYIRLVNSATGVPSSPSSVHVQADLLEDLQAAIRTMLPVVKGMLHNILLGVYLMRGLGSSAITDVVVDENGNILGSVVALDVDAFLSRSANAWATWKENTPFAQAKGLNLEVKIAEPEDDTRANAIQFLLLHEFGHVLTTGQRFLPIWWLGPEAMKPTADYAFLQLAWEIGLEKKIVPRREEEFAGRSAVSYYGSQGLDDDAMLAIYEGLQRTSFPTLYASTNAYDDFAETFATYVHTVLMRKPFHLRICSDGIIKLEHEDFWSSARSGPKRAFMAHLLAAE